MSVRLVQEAADIVVGCVLVERHARAVLQDACGEGDAAGAPIRVVAVDPRVALHPQPQGVRAMPLITAVSTGQVSLCEASDTHIRACRQALDTVYLHMQCTLTRQHML